MMSVSKTGKQRKLRREDKKLADRIRSLRIERGLSQEELSLRLGRNVSYIAYLETHRRGLGLPTLYKIAKIFEVKVRDLFTF